MKLPIRLETLGHFGGQVLEAMHRKIRLALEQAGIEFLREKPLVADLGERDIKDFVARGFDRERLETRLGKPFFQIAPHPISFARKPTRCRAWRFGYPGSLSSES